MTYLQYFQNFQAQLEKEALTVIEAQQVAVETGNFTLSERLGEISRQQISQLNYVQMHVQKVMQTKTMRFLDVAPAILVSN